MSRALPSPPLSSLPLIQIQALAMDSEPTNSRTPKEWFERAKHEADLAIIAERKGKKEDMFLAYTRSCTFYSKARSHPNYLEEKKLDNHWANRVKDFKETYEVFLTKAKDIKEQLKQRDVERAPQTSRPGPARSPSGPDIASMGSLADRMKALSGKGMDVGNPQSSKRISKDYSTPPTPITPNTAGVGGPSKVNSLRTTVPVTTTTTATNGKVTRDRSGSNSSMNTTATGKSGSGHSGLSIHPKPTHLNQKEDKSASSPIQQTETGSSTRSRYPTAPADLEGRSSSPIFSTITSHPVPTQRQDLPSAEAGPSRSQQPSIPHSPASRNVASHITSNGNNSNDSPNRLADFEKAFPSLSEFGRQWDVEEDGAPISGLPNGTTSQSSGGAAVSNSGSKYTQRQPTIHEDGDGMSDFKLPDVPSFPTLPSAPTIRPGLPPPPSRPESIFVQSPDNDEMKKAHSPPVPTPGAGLTRPASTPNVATLPGDMDLLSDEPVIESGQRDAHPSRPGPVPSAELSAPPLRPSAPRPDGSGNRDRTSPALTFPVAVPTPPPRESSTTSQTPSASSTNVKPKFPFANSIEPDTIRSYFLNPAVELLLLDIRSEDEYKRGYVGREYEPRGAQVNVVWLDPTVLLRDGMDSRKLEDALSLSPEAQRRAFESRHKYDLVIVYDTQSKSWPKKGEAPTPTSRLWDMIYEHEFSKRLPRTPVLLTGGYDAWREFIKMRANRHTSQAQVPVESYNLSDRMRIIGGKPPLNPPEINGANGNAGRPYNPKPAANGYAPSPTIRSPMQPDRVLSPTQSGELASKRANRDMPVYQSAHYAKNITDSFGYSPQSMTGEPTSYTGHQPARHYVSPSTSTGAISQSRSSTHSHSHTHTHSASVGGSSYSSQSTITAPPQASIHPGPGSRRRSDYVEQHGQAYSGSTNRPTIDYPQAHALTTVPQPPPPAAGPPLERYDARPAVVRSGSIRGLDLVAREGDEVRYWNDVVLGLTGLKNLGNTCYMNSTIQCLSATYPFTSYFLDGSYKRSINLYNPLGTKGNLANAFSELLKALWKEDYTFLSPVTFRKNIITFASQFSGTDQHDSQEFLSFVLDGLHEDLNRVKHKPPPVEMTPEREHALETLPPEVASEKEWGIYKMRNDSFIVDLFQGQYRNRLECLTCHKTSTTYDAFMYMSLPVPSNKKAVVVQELIDEFVRAEVMEKEDAWNCPRCKVPRTASKTLTIARLPPVLLIQLKRFTTQNGVFWDKSETPVIFPVKSLDLTRYLPYRQKVGNEDMDDPRTQIGPFKYDLYGVSNHMGTLSSGHYTAYVKSSKGWMYCEDSRTSKAQEKDVVSRPAYILFYKRVRA